MDEEDLEYYKYCLNADFFLYKGKFLLSDLINLPPEEELKKFKAYQIEKNYNHFHMLFISQNIDKQKKYALDIWEKWRSLFNKKFPQEIIEIQITDDGHEIIISVYRPWKKS